MSTDTIHETREVLLDKLKQESKLLASFLEARISNPANQENLSDEARAVLSGVFSAQETIIHITQKNVHMLIHKIFVNKGGGE
jgi:hypothetical protein